MYFRNFRNADVVQVQGKQQRRRRRKLASELVHDYGQNTTLHGLRYATDTQLSRTEKLFWIATFVISLSLCLYLMHNVWYKWRSSPVVVVLSEELVSVGQVPFPAITICPHIKAKRTVYNFSGEAVRIFQTIQKHNLTSEQINQDPSMNKFEDVGLICWDRGTELNSLVARNRSDAKTVKHIIEVSPNISDVLYMCYLRETPIDCEEFFVPVITKEGVCFTMNSLSSDEILNEENVQKDYPYSYESRTAKGWSPSTGYSVDTEDVYPRRGRDHAAFADFSMIMRASKRDMDKLCHGFVSGFAVYVHHPADLPQSYMYYYAALPMQTTSFAVNMNVLNTTHALQDYKPEIRQCYNPGERYLRYFKTYTSANCRLECLSNFTLQYCGCVWFHMLHNNSSLLCGEANRECTMEAKGVFASEVDGNSTENGKCGCLPPCFDIEYDADILRAEFDANSYYTYVKTLFPDDIYKKDGEGDEYIEQDTLSKIELYFKKPRFVAMRRSELFGLTDFLANCGGLLGLFLGFSLLSLVEIFYFCTLRLGCNLRRDQVDITENKK